MVVRRGKRGKKGEEASTSGRRAFPERAVPHERKKRGGKGCEKEKKNPDDSEKGSLKSSRKKKKRVRLKKKKADATHDGGEAAVERKGMFPSKEKGREKPERKKQGRALPAVDRTSS